MRSFSVRKIIFETKRIIGVAIIFFIMLACFNFLLLYLQRDLINIIINGNDNSGMLIKLILFLSVAFYIVNGTYNTHIRGYINNHLYDQLELKYLKRIMEKVYNVKLDTIYSKEFNDKHSFARNSRIHISRIIISFIELIFENILTIIFISAIVFVDIRIVLIFLIYVLLKIRLNMSLSKREVDFEKLNSNNKRKIDYFQNVLVDRKYGKELKLFKSQEGIYNNYHELNSEYENNKYKLIRNNQFISGIIELINKLITIGLICFIAYFGVINDVNIAEVIIMIQAVILLDSTVKKITKNILDINKSRVYIKGIKEFLNISVKKKSLFNEEIESIELVGCSYKYPNQEEDTLKNINLSVAKGETLCVVGYTGAGKTTLVKVLSNLLNVSSGKVLINNKDVTNKNVNNDYNFMFQDYTKFAFTIKDNIVFGSINESFDEERYNYAIDKSNLRVVIERYGDDQYLDKSFSSEGIDFSEGMWQSLAFARMLYSNKNIFICDEPTASLDAIKESSYISNLKEILNGKTAIIITHRLSLTSIADKIAVLDKGEVIESGTKESLLKEKGMFYNMLESQNNLYRGGNNE